MAADGNCPGPCNARYREAQEAWREDLALYDPLDPAQSRPQPPDVTPWPGDPVWCGGCAARISQRLGVLDDLASTLERYADGHRDAPDTPLVAGTGAAMSPSEAKDTADDLAHMLGGWEHAYRELKGWPYPRREEDTMSWVTACSAWLHARLTVILASPIAEDFGTEILSWHRDLASRTKAGKRALRKPLRCPGCSLLTLVWTEGEESVRCGHADCGRVLTLTDYYAMVERQAGEKPSPSAGAA